MTHPGPDPAPSWQQPPIVLTRPGLASGEDPEPPMWAQPGEAAEIVPVTPSPSSTVSPTTPVAMPETRSGHRVNAIIGRVPSPGVIFYSLVFWAATVTFSVLQGAPPWLSVVGILAFGMSLVNLVRWLRHRH